MSAGLCPKSWAGSQEGKSPELTGTRRDPSCQPCAQPRAIPGTGDAAKPELSADPTGSPGGIPACSPAWHFSHFSLWWKGCLEHSLGLSLYSGTFCPKMTTSVFSFLLKNFWCPFSPSPPLIVPLLGLAAAVNPSLSLCWIKDAFSLPPMRKELQTHCGGIVPPRSRAQHCPSDGGRDPAGQPAACADNCDISEM